MLFPGSPPRPVKHVPPHFRASIHVQAKPSLARLRRRPIHVPNPSARFNATPSVQPSTIPSDATTNVRRGEMQPSSRIHGRAHPLPRFNTAPCVQLPHDPCRLHHHLAARSNMMRPETCTSTAPHFPASTPSRCLLRHDPLPQQTWIDETPRVTCRAENVVYSCQLGHEFSAPTNLD